VAVCVGVRVCVCVCSGVCMCVRAYVAVCVPRFGHGLCGQQHGLAMNWVDQPCTSADERDVVCSPRCRDCVWAVQGLVVFLH